MNYLSPIITHFIFRAVDAAKSGGQKQRSAQPSSSVASAKVCLDQALIALRRLSQNLSWHNYYRLLMVCHQRFSLSLSLFISFFLSL